MIASRRRIEVVHLVSSLNIGGLEMVVLNLARLADQERFSHRVLCWGESGALAPRFAPLGVPVESLAQREPSVPRRFRWLVRRLRQLRPDVIHTHNPSPHVLGAAATRLVRVPVLVHTKHGRNFPGQLLRVLLNRLASAVTDFVVPVSGDAADVARRVERIPARKLRLIRNGVDLDGFLAPGERDPASSKRAVHVARLDPVKDQGTLLRAARLVVDAVPDFSLDLVGDGPSRPELEALSASLSLQNHVRFLGFRTDVRELLYPAGLFLLSSVSEGISLTLLEAMGTALPVIATDVGGNREVVSHGETGLLVPPRSPEKLADAVLTLVRDPGRTLEMGRAGRRKVEREFDLRRMVADYEGLYRSLLNGKGT